MFEDHLSGQQQYQLQQQDNKKQQQHQFNTPSLSHIVNLFSGQIPTNIFLRESDRILLPFDQPKQEKNYFNLAFSSPSYSSFASKSLPADTSSERLKYLSNSYNISCREQQFTSNNLYYFKLSNTSLNDGFSGSQKLSSNNGSCECLDQDLSNNKTHLIQQKVVFSPAGHCINYEDRSWDNIFAEQKQNVAVVVGYICLILASLFFIITMYSLFFAGLIGPSTHFLLEFIRLDRFYCYLIPLFCPIIMFFIYANWLSMKFFQHS